MGEAVETLGKFMREHWHHLLFAILVLVFFIHGIASFDQEINRGNTDPVEYYKRATNFANGDLSGVDDYFSPGYVIILGLFMKLFGVSVITAKLLSLLGALAAMVLVYALANITIKDKFVALATGLFFLLDHFINFYAVNVYKEMFFLFILVLIVYIFAYVGNNRFSTKKSVILYAIVGIAFGIGVYFNSWVYALLLLIAYPLLMKRFGWKRKQKISISDAWPILALVVGFFLITIIFNSAFFIPQNNESTYFLTNGGPLLYFGNNPTSESNVAFTSRYTDITKQPLVDYASTKGIANISDLSRSEYSSLSTSYVFNFWKQNPSFLFKRVGEFLFSYWLFPSNDWAQRFITNWTKVSIYLWIKWILVLVGLIQLIRLTKKHLLRVTALFYPILLVTGVYGLTIYLLRYKLYILPFQIIIASVGLVFIGRFIGAIIKESTKSASKKT